MDQGARTYSKFANLDIINTGSFFLFCGTQSQSGHESAEEVEGAEDEASAEEGV